MKKCGLILVCLGWLLAAATRAQAPLTMTIDADARGAAIPDDFTGLSFESSNLLPGGNGRHLFSPQNKPLIRLFRTLGIKNLRVGGATVDMARYSIPDESDIDELFGFARAAGVKVIYTLRLLNGTESNAIAAACYIQSRYRRQLACFAVGNEPDWQAYHRPDPRITDYPSYLARWREFAAALDSAAPGIKLAGPDTGSDWPVPQAADTRYEGETWTRRFADDEKGSKFVAAIFQHDYVGQSAAGVDVQTAIGAMLSRDWMAAHEVLYNRVLSPVLQDGLPYRMTECNDYTGGVDGASNRFASALWALDYMHWWAAHGCAGVNFHNKTWIHTDTIHRDSTGVFRLNPKAYGIKAFNLGSHGRLMTSVAFSNPEGVNVDGFAVGTPRDLYVTLINKTHGPSGTDVMVTIQPLHFAAAGASCLVLESVPAGHERARAALLGGAAITDDGAWHGRWAPLRVSRDGRCRFQLKKTTAVVIHLYKRLNWR